MNREIVTKTRYSDPELDDHLKREVQTLRQEILDLGKETGEKNTPKTKEEFHTRSINTVQPRIQRLLDYNHRHLTPVCDMVLANTLEKVARDKCWLLTASVNDDETEQKRKHAAAAAIRPEFELSLRRILVILLVIAIASFDGFQSYPAFRDLAMPFIAAVMCAIGVGVAVLLAHALAGWVRSAESKQQFYHRYVFILGMYLIGFLIIGFLRANAYNSIISVGVTDQAAVAPVDPLMAVGIALVSFFLFWLCLFASVRYWITKAESKQLSDYQVAKAEADALEQKISHTRQEITQIEQEAISQKRTAMQAYEYALANENWLISEADDITQAFITKNLRYRSDGCPPFYAIPHNFSFITFFDRVKKDKK